MKSDQLSQTAAFVAIKFYGLTQIDSYRSIFDNSDIQFYENLVKSLPAPFKFYHFWLKYRWVRAFYIWSEEKLLPGDLLHVVARKWYIQRMADKIIDQQGYEQLLVLGAGFDHLAFHYAQKEVASFEFDAPYMSGLKNSFLKKMYPDRPHPTIIQAYLPTDSLSELLTEHIDPNKKTLVVAEGFFDYLESDTVTDLLANLKDFFTYKPTLISTHFALDELSPFHRKVFEWSVKIVGEKLQFHTPMPKLKKLLSEQGWQIRQLYDSKDIREELYKKILTSLPVLKGFYIFMAN